MIRGVIPVSMLDWPGHVASVVFLGGCNWLCEYCHNRDLNSLEKIRFDDVIKEIKPVKEMVDHVIISGGEPTLWKEYLEELISEFKNEGFKVGLHTNGSNPAFLKKILPTLDFVGIDIKGGENIYTEWIHGAILKDVESSVRILQLSDIDYEFRSTMYPPYINNNNIEDLFNLLRKWHISDITIQQFQNSKETIISSIKYGELKSIIDQYSYGVNVFYRGFDKFIIK